MREVTEYKWEELRQRLRHRIVKTATNMDNALDQFNDKDIWEKIKALIEKDKYDAEIHAYHRILETMESLEKEEAK